MWESGYTLPACVTAAGLLLFGMLFLGNVCGYCLTIIFVDNAHIGQTRLILLDSTLIFSMAVSVLAYVRFYKQRHAPFSRKWWKWLIVTGIALSCVISTKYVGVFTFFTIGAAVAVDLWNLLDIKRGLTIDQFARHFLARAFGLIAVPFFFYLFWFQVHFSVLYRSGPGDAFMSTEFQETLSDNLLALNSQQINYFDTIVLRHKETKAYLHSHPDRYPLRYEDGRVSSQGQQVTGYPFNDTNNHWIIMPGDLTMEGGGVGQPVRNLDLVKLKHVVTNTVLLSHDVASPYYPTNQEFTTVSVEDASGKRHNDTLFQIRVENGKHGQVFKTLGGFFKLIHHPSKVAMWTHGKPLPEWGFKQQEINGNKNIAQSSNIWFVEEIPSLPEDDVRRKKEPRKVKYMPFWKKYLELQRAMFHHNNALTSSHPYASQPIQWPFLLRGVSFWTKSDTRQQIYFLGNPIGWWLASSLLAVFIGIVAADQLCLRRGVDTLDKRTRSRLYNSGGFFFLAWAAHYLPFFLMGRQLFLHHYLPAHLASCMVTGALLEFVFCLEPLDANYPPAGKTKDSKIIARQTQQSLIPAWIATVVILSIVFACFMFYAPLTYGSPGLDVPGVIKRKMFGLYDLHFAK